MKILMLNYEYPPLGGGASPFTKELSTELSKKHQVDVVTMGYKGLKKSERKGKLTIFRVPCIRMKKESSNAFEMLTYVFSAFFKSINLVKKNKYDVIHSHFIIPTSIIAYALKKLFKVKYIISSHGSDVPGYNPDRFKLLHKLIFPVWGLIARNAEYIHAPSNTMKNIILNKKRLNNINVIPYGVYIKKSKTKKKEKIILYAGRLFERKGVQYLLRASTKLPRDWKIIVAGEGYYKQNLINFAKTIKTKVEFTGWLSKQELHKLYRKSSIFVLPSLEESFGIVLAEGMMYSNAIITSKGTACEEVVGNSGILVQKKNVEELEKALLSLISNKKLLKNYQKKAQKKIVTYSWDNVLNKYLSLYKKVHRS